MNGVLENIKVQYNGTSSVRRSFHPIQNLAPNALQTPVSGPSQARHCTLTLNPDGCLDCITSRILLTSTAGTSSSPRKTTPLHYSIALPRRRLRNAALLPRYRRWRHPPSPPPGKLLPQSLIQTIKTVAHRPRCPSAAIRLALTKREDTNGYTEEHDPQLGNAGRQGDYRADGGGGDGDLGGGVVFEQESQPDGWVWEKGEN